MGTVRFKSVVLLCALFFSFILPASSAICADTPMDLVFAADSSTSMLPREFSQVKDFLAKLVQQLHVGQDHVRVALVRFSSYVDVIAYLNQSDSPGQFQNFISNMTYRSGGTNTYTTLRVIREDVLSVAKGNREDAPDVVVIITDGKPWKPSVTLQESRLLKDKGVSIVAFGVGTSISLRDLQAMSSASDLVRIIGDFDDLQSVVDSFRENLCGVAFNNSLTLTTATSASTSPSTVITTQPVLTPDKAEITAPNRTEQNTAPSTDDQHGEDMTIAECDVDLVFVLDSSNSVSDVSFRQAKDFIANITRSLPLGARGVRVGLLRYGNGADVIFPLMNISDVAGVIQAIESMKHVKEGTNTAAALETVRVQMLTEDKELRPRTVVVLITDGVSEDVRATRSQASQLRKEDVHLVWLFIGDNSAMMREKRSMARKGDTTFETKSFGELGETLRSQIIQASCEEETTTQPPTTTVATPSSTSQPPTTTTPTTTLTSSTTEPSTTTVATPSSTPQPPMTTTLTTTHTSSTTEPSTTTVATPSSTPQPWTTTTSTTTSLTSSTTEPPTTTVATLSSTPQPPTTTTSITTEVTTAGKPDPGTPTTSKSDKGNDVTTIAAALEPPAQTTSSTTETPYPDSSPTTSVATDASIVQTRTHHSVRDLSTAPADLTQGKTARKSGSEGGWQEEWVTGVGIGVGVVALIGVSSAIIFLIIRRRRSRRDEKGGEE